ncbi:hypothetical protein RUND412_008873 [Rhizina undulata]
MVTSKIFRIKDVPTISTVDDTKQILRGKLSEAENQVEINITFVPACYCDQRDTKWALVDFHPIPQFLHDVANDKTESQNFHLEMGDSTLVIDVNFYGFTQLYDVKETEIEADIVAVTGLGGHAYGSWRGKQTKKMWLRDFLAKDLPNCRTMIYGYNTNLNSRGIHTLNDYKIEFLNEIAKIRNSEEEIKRPIIFIGHSFGGIVIVQSLVEAATRKGEIDALVGNSYLVAATCAVIFFGTPHRGISMEDVRKMLAHYDVHNPRIGLLDEIKNERNLEPDLENFFKLAEGFKVVSFYERIQTAEVAKNSENRYTRSGDFKSTVDTDSALLHLPKDLEDPIPVNSDHTNIVKFDNRRDTTYGDVVHRIQKYLKTGPSHVKERIDALDAGAGSWWDVTRSTISQNTNSIANSSVHKPRQTANSGSNEIQAQQWAWLQALTPFLTWNGPENEHLTPEVANLSAEAFDSAPFEIMEDVIQVGGSSVAITLISTFHEYNISVKLPFHRNRKFCGRADILENMKQLLQAHDIMEPLENNPEMPIVGVGKSQIALEFAYRFSHCYTWIFWIDAENVFRTTNSAHKTVQQLIDHYTTKWQGSPDYSEIADILGIPGKIIIDDSGNMKEMDTETAMNAVHNWLGKNENRGWLVLVEKDDNPEEGELDKLIPMCDWGSVVVTTRLPELDSFGEGIEIEGVGSEVGLDFLLESSGKTRQSLNDSELGNAKNIVRTLREFPLALDQAGAYIRLLHISFHSYREMLRNGMKTAFKQKLPGICLSADKASVFTTWELSFHELSENARHLLHVCAFLSNEDIPVELFRRGKSAIYWIEDVHHWARDHIDRTAQRQTALDTVTLVRTAIHDEDEDKLRNRKFHRRILTHLEICRSHVSEYLDGTENIQVVDAWSNIASAFKEFGCYEEAEDLYKKALQWKEKALGKVDRSTLETMEIIAWFVANTKRYDEAMEWFQRLIERKEESLGKDNASMLATMHSIARFFAIKKRYDQALEWYQRLLESKEKALGQDDSSTLDTMDNIARLLATQARYDEAQELFQKLVERKGKVFGEEDPSTLETINEIARFFDSQERYSEALEWFQRLLERKEKSLGEEDPSTLQTINDVERIVDQQKQSDVSLEGSYKAAEVAVHDDGIR